MYDGRDVLTPGRWDDADGGRTVHLCHECRDLLRDVVDSVQARLIEPPLPEPDWLQALRWLDDRCGGREAVLRLDTEPLTSPVALPPVAASGEVADLARSVGALLDGVADRFFDPEVGVAFRNALALYLDRGAARVLQSQPVDRVALGVVWVVGKANGLLGQSGVTTEKAIKEHLSTTGSGSFVGQRIRQALGSAYAWTPGSHPWSWRADLEAVGQPLILTAATRARLIEVRDRAVRLRADAQRSEAGPDNQPARSSNAERAVPLLAPERTFDV